MDRYRAAAIAEKETAADKFVGPTMPIDFGYAYPHDFVDQAAVILIESNWMAWPYAGTWADQPSDLVDDILMCLKLKRRAKWEVENGITSSQIATQSYNPDSNGKRYGLGRT